MKATKMMIMLGMLFLGGKAFAQDSVKVVRDEDTVRIGGIIILKKGTPDEKKRVRVTVGSPSKKRQSSNLTTSSSIIDIGFSNWVDKTDYSKAAAENDLVTRPGDFDLGSKDFKLRTGKSVNINIWFVMQRLNLIDHYVNLKYGIGLELNNYRFTNPISFKEGGPNPYVPSQNIPHAFVFRDSIAFSKNKLAADYITVPLMLNFKTNKYYNNRGLSLSGGVSMGYLYSSRNKQKSDSRGKEKNRGDYDLNKWKFSYVGELGLGPVHLYGSYSPKSIFTNDLNFQPYTIGLRLGGF